MGTVDATPSALNNSPPKNPFKPSMEEILTLGITERMSSRYQNAGQLLGLNLEYISRLKQRSLMDNRRTCELIFEHWVKNNGHPPNYPLTWKGLYNLLCDIQHRKLAEDMKYKLASKEVRI